MRITHVIRAEEWLSSLPKHVQLYRSFGWEMPVFCHLPLLRNADKSKISKRKNPVSLNHYRRAGFFPEALVNYLALMGGVMANDQEEFTLDGVRGRLLAGADLPGRARLRPPEAGVAQRQVPAQDGAAGAARAPARVPPLRRVHAARAAAGAGAHRHPGGVLRIRPLLLRGRGRLRRGRDEAARAQGPDGGGDGQGAPGPARGAHRSPARMGGRGDRGRAARVRGGRGLERRRTCS